MTLLSRIKDGFLGWYNGKYTQPDPDDPASSIVIISAGHFERHWTASVAVAVVALYLRHWQWLWPTAIAIATLWVSVLALK